MKKMVTIMKGHLFDVSAEKFPIVRIRTRMSKKLIINLPAIPIDSISERYGK
jgi:hypothetical protein